MALYLWASASIGAVGGVLAASGPAWARGFTKGVAAGHVREREAQRRWAEYLSDVGYNPEHGSAGHSCDARCRPQR